MIKILHTGDWHLDSPLQGRPEAQASFLRRELLKIPGKIAALCKQEGCDLVLLAGDLFDGAYTQESYRVVCQALQEMGLDLSHEHVLQSQSTLADGARAIKKLLRMKPMPQAVICANNPIALGLMQALQAKGIRIPEDMALITFDSYPFSLFTEPPMTVVDINMYEMGQEAGRLVLQKLRHPATQIQTYITTPTLVCRGTTAIDRE